MALQSLSCMSQFATTKGKPVTEMATLHSNSLDEFESNIVERTFEIYRRLTGPAPSRHAHAAGTPWHAIQHHP